VGAAHRRYTHFINARGRWTGHLFQSRLASVVMDEGHLIAAVRYVGLNPVRARLVAHAENWPWPSARAHPAGENDALVNVKPVLARIADFAGLPGEAGDAGFAAIRNAETTGRQLGDHDFIAGPERLPGRTLARRAPGPKPRKHDVDSPQLR
jgi:putative transposase